MQTAKNKNQKYFNDGVMKVYESVDRTLSSLVFEKIYFQKEKVGITRFYQAKTVGDEIDLLISIPIVPKWRTNYVCEIDENFYTVTQKQEVHDTIPPTYTLTLKRAPFNFTNGTA